MLRIFELKGTGTLNGKHFLDSPLEPKLYTLFTIHWNRDKENPLGLRTPLLALNVSTLNEIKGRTSSYFYKWFTRSDIRRVQGMQAERSKAATVQAYSRHGRDEFQPPCAIRYNVHWRKTNSVYGGRDHGLLRRLFIGRQSTSEILKSIKRIWSYLYLGSPDHLVVDQGSAYTPLEMKENYEAHGVQLKKIPI